MLDGWLFGEESERRLRITVSLLAATITWRVLISPAKDPTNIPASIFDPPFYRTMFAASPALWVVNGVRVAGIVSGMLATLAKRPRLNLIVAWLCLLFLAGLRASRGKIMHPDVVLILTTVPFLFAPADARFNGGRRGARYGTPLRAGIAVVALAYFFTGFQKLATSGWSWVSSDNIRWVLYRAAHIFSGHAPGVAGWLADRPWICHLIAFATIAVECGALLVVPFARLRIPFALAVTGFHLGIYVLLGLDYSLWATTAWIVLVDWDSVAARVARLRGRAPQLA